MRVIKVLFVLLFFFGPSFYTVGQDAFQTIPSARSIQWQKTSTYSDAVLKDWAKREIPFKSLNGKNSSARIILAKMVLHQDLNNANKAIVQMKAWGVSGTSWKGNKLGDYDFLLTPLTTILYLFGDQPDVLYPSSKTHLLNNLLTEQGNRFRYTAPNTLGLIPETENHLLMTEGSKYLKNRWISLHGNQDNYYNNEKNGLEAELSLLLTKLKTTGLYEFNSIPYIAYTITALLNLEAFGSEKIRTEARDVLDYINWTYALGSFQLKHYPAMRRRYEKVFIQEIKTDYQAIFVNTWLSYLPNTNFISNTNINEAHAVIAASLPYRPSDKIIDLIFNKGEGYFVQLGHGKKSTPEIYSAGKHFLISSGGANRGYFSQIVTRPITIFLEDSAKKLSDCFHLEGPGNDFMHWNNTGVYRYLACAAGAVHVPSFYSPLAKKGNWAVYQANNNVSLFVFSTPTFGLVYIDTQFAPLEILNTIIQLNPDEVKLQKQFTYPDKKSITYDVHAKAKKWVISSYDNITLKRVVDQWPLIKSN